MIDAFSVSLLDADWPAIVVRTLWQSTVLFALVGTCVVVFRDRVAPRWQFVLWGIVLIRLVMVVTPESRLSAFNFLNPTLASITSAQSIESPGQPTNEFAIRPEPELVSAELISPRVKPETEIASLADQGTHPPKAADAGIIETSGLAEPVRNPILRLVRWLFLIWMAGCLYFLIRVFLASRRLRACLDSCEGLSCETTQATFAALCQQLNVQDKPTLLVSNASHSPFLAGFFRPQIVLPIALLESADSDEIRFVLSHELAHVRRRDVLMQWLAIAVRTIYWFHPCAWLACSRMQACRESACDDLVVSQLSNEQRVHYGKTLLKLASQLQPPALAPGLCGWFSRESVQHRVVRLANGQSNSWTKKVGSATLVACIAFTGLTDSHSNAVEAPPVKAQEDSNSDTALANSDKDATQVQGKARTEQDTFVAKGRFINDAKERSPVANAKVQLFEVRGIQSRFREIGTVMTDAEGRYEFSGLKPPNRLHFQSLDYLAIVSAEGRPTILSGYYSMRDSEEDIPTVFTAGAATLTGRVTDENGTPLAGATVRRDYYRQRVPPGLREFVTKADGTFVLGDLPKPRKASAYDNGAVSIIVSHPDFAETKFSLKSLKFANLKMPPSCKVDGSIVCGADKQPLRTALIRAIPKDHRSGLRKQSVATDEDGKFRLVLGEGSYELIMEAEGNDWVAKMVSINCRAGNPIQLKPIEATRGGWITGQLINAETGQPQSMTYLHEDQLARNPNAKPEPITVGVLGAGRSGKTQEPLTVLDAEGRFRIRVCPGEHYPYLQNIRVSRMLWTTDEVDPVVVREGQTVDCPMTFTAPKTKTEKIAVGQKVLEGLPTEIPSRVDAIIDEFRKLNHTVDECETWCLLMKELATIGKPAVPALCKELDQTDNQRMLRRLSFALRAIGDANAMPALIRAIPKTLQPPMSDYGLIVADPELAAFMRQNQIKSRGGAGMYFDLGRPVREMQSALERIAKHKVGGTNLANVTRRKDKRALESQRNIYYANAERWAKWWDTNSANFDVAPENRLTKLPPYVPTDFSDYPSGLRLTKDATLDGISSGNTISPIGDDDHRSSFFLDLDFGRAPEWPNELPKADASQETVAAATTWAAKRGLDLICVASEKRDGSVVYTLKGIDMQVWEIDRIDGKRLVAILKKGTLPSGRKLSQDLLLHQNAQGELESARRSCFLYLTRQQGLGVIQIDDFVTVARDVTGMFQSPEGVGFNRGVRFTIYQIAR